MSPNAQPRRASWLIKAVILASPIPNTLAFLSVTPVLPKMLAALGHDGSQAYLVRMVLGIVGIAMVFAAPLAGVLADKVPRRFTFTAAALLFALAGVTPFLTDNLPVILASRILMGLGSMTCYIVGCALIADYFEDIERARWNGVSIGVAVVFGILALFLSGILGDIGWRFAFLNYLIGAPIAILSWIGLRGSPLPTGALSKAAAAPAKQRLAFPYGLFVLSLMIGIVSFAPSVYIPSRLGALGADKPSLIGPALMLGMLTVAVSSALFGRVRRLMSSRAAFYWCFILVAAGLAIIGLAPSYPVALIGLFIQGLGVGPTVPNLITATADAVEESIRGRVIGLVKMGYAIAPAIGVTALEPIVRRVGPSGVILLVAGICVATAAVIFVGGLRRQTVAAQPPLSGAAGLSTD